MDKNILKISAVFLSLIFILACTQSERTLSRAPYQVTGIKICEVDTESVVIWTRLTRHESRFGKDRPIPTVSYRNPETGELSDAPVHNAEPVVEFSEGSEICNIEGAVPGIAGEVRVIYKMVNESEWQKTEWRKVDQNHDYTANIKLSDLNPGIEYLLKVESRSRENGGAGQTVDGSFRTAPAADTAERIVFTVTTGQAYPDQDAPEGGYRIYPSMLKLAPDFFVHTGDIVYYDKLAKSPALARLHWARTYSLPTNVSFHRQVASYFIKDDHDTWMDDCWPGMKTKFMGDFTFSQGQDIFLEQVGLENRTYRTVRWGKDLQIWLVEGRDFRSPNIMPDGPDKTIWGKEQKEWFKRTVKASDASFRVLISPTPIVGPDRKTKNDNHSNKGFSFEGNELREFIADQENMVVVCGDRHWQYISVDSETGLREYSCGPASDKHAGGWSNDKLLPEHRYLNVTGGFLCGIVERERGKPILIFRHYSVDGDLLNEDKFEITD